MALRLRKTDLVGIVRARSDVLVPVRLDCQSVDMARHSRANSIGGL